VRVRACARVCVCALEAGERSCQGGAARRERHAGICVATRGTGTPARHQHTQRDTHQEVAQVVGAHRQLKAVGRVAVGGARGACAERAGGAARRKHGQGRGCQPRRASSVHTRACVSRVGAPRQCFFLVYALPSSDATQHAAHGARRAQPAPRLTWAPWRSAGTRRRCTRRRPACGRCS
jgi:hypothetical protein